MTKVTAIGGRQLVIGIRGATRNSDQVAEFFSDRPFKRAFLDAPKNY